MKLLLASHNHGKATEIARLLEGTGWRVVSLTSVDSKFDVVEDGLTFRDNAQKKALAAAGRFKMWTLADDSGLVIDALDGEPGVHSARYCGPDATDADRVRRVLDRMIAVPAEKRTARFRCAMCLVDIAGSEEFFEGEVEGRIAHHPRGTAGFGYDPVFIPDGHSRTFAELGVYAKNTMSHRARAMRKVVEYLKSRTGGAGGFDRPPPGGIHY